MLEALAGHVFAQRIAKKKSASKIGSAKSREETLRLAYSEAEGRKQAQSFLYWGTHSKALSG